jgi:putative transposase
MPKFARLVVPDCPHHITQRGNRRQKVFFNETDRLLYLRLIRRLGHRAGIEYLAYCLMENHVHLIAIPKTRESLAYGLGEAHRIYTTAVNIREEWKGYLWQGRFWSFPLSDEHLYKAIRYVEMNPVRAGIVSQPEDYRWSSASAHINGAVNPMIPLKECLSDISDWKAFLHETDSPEFQRLFKQHQKTGRPLGDDGFLTNLETITGRKILPQKRGPKGHIDR